MELLSSALLAGFPHGFTTRHGGVSTHPFEGLNLGGNVGDDPGAVEGNWRALAQATGLEFARVRQVHGDRVILATGACAPKEEADAVVSTHVGVAACISVADCVPILIGDPRSGGVAAVHAGWRGTMARAAARAVEFLARTAGAVPGDLLAAIGPSIGPCCFEVSPDLAQAFREEFGARVAEPRGCDTCVGEGGSCVDLWLANELVLRQAGLDRERIEVLGRCTYCERETFFSHRRDQGKTGRQVGFIAPAAPPLS